MLSQSLPFSFPWLPGVFRSCFNLKTPEAKDWCFQFFNLGEIKEELSKFNTLATYMCYLSSIILRHAFSPWQSLKPTQMDSHAFKLKPWLLQLNFSFTSQPPCLPIAGKWWCSKGDCCGDEQQCRLKKPVEPFTFQAANSFPCQSNFLYIPVALMMACCTMASKFQALILYSFFHFVKLNLPSNSDGKKLGMWDRVQT